MAGQVVSGNTPETDREVLLQLKSFLLSQNKVNRGRYVRWGDTNSNPCDWPDITCNNERVTRIYLSNCNMSGNMFGNFSALTELTDLDLSANTIGGVIPDDLNGCSKLKHLNLSHNILEGEFNLTGLNSLEALDLTVNRLVGEVQLSFPAMCQNLILLNISSNRFKGKIDNCFNDCPALQYLDLSSNNFTGQLWLGFPRLQEFSVSENNLTGELLTSTFPQGCNLKVLDLSENHFYGQVPEQIANCISLSSLVLWGNNFTGRVPASIGSLSNLEVLVLGKNKFFKEVPESLLNCSNLSFLDMSRNGFGGDIQEIFGRFMQVKYLVLHSNSYTGGIHTSGILKLGNVSRLDLSYNNFSTAIPVEFSNMSSLKYLYLAHNQFTGNIPFEFGNLSGLQALDLSYNMLTGAIPPTLGKLSSLLWLMLANNSLTGEIPPEIGNCGSLLWLNLANNQLSGKIPPQLPNIGINITSTFLLNRQSKEGPAGSGECLAMRRWLPADYPPFSFVYTLLTRKSCRSLWNKLLKGYGVFQICLGGSTVRTLQISGYVQLSGNQLSGEVPPEVGRMQNFSLLHLGMNNFSGKLPREIVRMPLVVLNISHNAFSGEIPSELGTVKCLQNLDLSFNNFSGVFPTSLNNLTELSKFNVSYNPLISGVIPLTGQLATFERDSFLGDPLLQILSLRNNSGAGTPSITNAGGKSRKPTSMAAFLVFLILTFTLLVCGLLSFIFCLVAKQPAGPPGFLLEDTKYRHDIASSSCGSSPLLSDSIKIIRLDKTAFTYFDILKATRNLSEERIIGKGGFGTVYHGMLPDGREIAVKKLQREGPEGEREFHAEMEVLSSTDIGWPHANLVTLYGWCLNGSQKLLVYEYMEGGSLEDLLTDRMRLTWRRRIEVAIGVARALVFLHHECYPAIVHRDVKASNVLLDREGTAHVTDFGLARVVGAGESHVSTIVAGTVGYVAPEYGHTWHATTKGDVYSFGILAMELATARRAVDGGEECLLEWARRVIGDNGRQGLSLVVPVLVLGHGLTEGAEEICELLKIGLRCTAEAPQARPNMKEVLLMLIKISNDDNKKEFIHSSPTKSTKDA
ncbi:hypothetical protein IFM89_034409 [Coptis chinensis]|uniref:non-specific serine/threonine protein kinase n=1 Tax=Coptis chinensis TaxID=261450 RepID=A0A835IZ72_9MAGN|nr:hypothetical protein IFM89_034409 [Coptis chinensis]